MTNSIQSLQTSFWKWTLVIFGFLVILYIGLRITPIMKGVKLSIKIPTQSEITNDTFTLVGQAPHARSLFVNGRSIFIDTDGKFTDEIILSPGMNKIEIVAEDVRGNYHEKEFFLTGSEIKNVPKANEFATLQKETITN